MSSCGSGSGSGTAKAAEAAAAGSVTQHVTLHEMLWRQLDSRFNFKCGLNKQLNMKKAPKIYHPTFSENVTIYNGCSEKNM